MGYRLAPRFLMWILKVLKSEPFLHPATKGHPVCLLTVKSYMFGRPAPLTARSKIGAFREPLNCPTYTLPLLRKDWSRSCQICQKP